METSQNLVGNWLKMIVFAGISLALVLGTFFLEGRLSAGGLSKHVDDYYRSVEFLQNRGILFEYQYKDYLSRNYSSDSSDMSGIYTITGPVNAHILQDGSYLLELGNGGNLLETERGKFWANFSGTTHRSAIYVDSVVLIPDQAVFDADYDGTRLTLNVYDGDVYVGFLPAKLSVRKFMDPYSSIFINRLLVPRGNSLTVPMSKVTEEISPLLYSKLVKEFKLASLSSEAKDSDWVKFNMKKDKARLENMRQQFSADILDGGKKVHEGFLSDFIFWSEENLTFVPAKKHKMYLDHLFNYLDDAIFYANQDLQDEADKNMQLFVSYMSILNQDILQTEEFEQRFNSYTKKLEIFGPGDGVYEIMKELLAQRFVAGKDRTAIVASFWNDVYKGLNSSDTLAEEALNSYYEYFDKTRAKNTQGEVDENFYRMYLAYQNQLFDNLLLKYPLFYRDGYFSIKTIFENDLLSLYESGQMKDELKQAFVNSKINFMKRLRRFFFDGQIDVKKAKEIYKRLFAEINDLMPKDNSGLAVVKLFESQLADMDDFWGYLEAPEYHSTSYGSTHDERYKLYLQDRKTILSFTNIKQNVLGEAPVQNIKKSIQEITDSVQQAFQANTDVSNLEIGKIEKEDQRFIPVNFVLGGYPVTGTYDRDNDAVKEVVVYDEEVSERAVKLDDLLQLLQQKFAELSSKELENYGEETIETTAQRTARNFIAKKIADLGFNVKAENVKVVDQLNVVYRIENTTFKERTDMKVTFDVLMNGELITNALVTIKGEPQILNGKYTFEEFAGLMTVEKGIAR